MSDPRRGQPPPDEIDLTGREFLDAQEPQSPATVAEMRDATRHAFDSVIKTLGTTASLEEWISATNDLEVAFFESHDGALAEQIRLLLEKDTLDAAEWAQSEDLVRQTAAVASHIYPIIHRLQALGFAATREDVVRKLETGDLSTTTKVHNVSVAQRRRTLIGLLRDLDAKVGANVWSLEFPPEIPSKIVVSDPFDEGADNTAKLWRHRIVAKNAVEPGVAHSIYTTSGDITAKVAYELDQIGRQTDDTKLKGATSTIVAWLDRKSLYYQDPDKRDFALYHLGMEQPEELMKIFRSLDTIKHADPELLLELVGINPDGGGASPYFGSFLHKALFNTQRIFERGEKLGEMRIRAMFKQLLTLDATVSTYSGVVSQESMNAMGAQIKDRVAAQPTDADRAKALMLMAVPFTQVAMDAEVRSQMENLRGIDLEKIKDAFKYRIDDIEHPLKLLEYLKWLPRATYDDEEIRRAISTTFNIMYIHGDVPWPDATTVYDRIHDEATGLSNVDLVTPLYRRIPMLDESRADLGFGRRMVIVTRDLMDLNGVLDGAWVDADENKKVNDAKKLQHLVGAENLLLLCTEGNIRALSSQLSRFGKNFLSSVALATFRSRLDEVTLATSEQFLQHIESDPFRYGQILVENIAATSRIEAIDSIPNPDIVLLSVLANPNGAAVAFKHFDKFCARIKPERMYQILRDQIPNAPTHPALEKFQSLFRDMAPEAHTDAYVEHLRAKVRGMWRFPEYYGIRSAEFVDVHFKLNRALVEKKTPWSVSVEVERVDSAGIIVSGAKFKETLWFDLWNTIENSDAVLSVGFDGTVMATPSHEKIEWGVREQQFVAQQLREGFATSLVRNTKEHGLVLIMYKLADANNARHMLLRGTAKDTVSLRDDPRFHILPLNLKSRPA